MGLTCQQLGPILNIVVYAIKIIQWFIPILLIALATFDFIKIVTSNDEKQMNEAKSNIGKRLVYAVIIFLIPIIVRMGFRLLENVLPKDELGTSTSWVKCFNEKMK